MVKRKSPLGFIILIIVVLGIGVGVFLLIKKGIEASKNKQQDTIQEDTNIDTETETDTDIDTVVPEVPQEEEVEEIPEVEDTDTDFSSFSTSKQTVGTSTNSNEYTLKSITDSKKDGYHRFVFAVQGKTSEVMDSPYVVVEYRLAQGVVRVDLNGVTKDESGIGYQKSRTINEQGISKLYHNISADPKEELYDIGVTKSTSFKVSSVETTNSTWNVTVDVKYPGGTVSTGIYGSETFSKDLQALDGALTPDNARVNSYSYSTAGGVLTLAFNVSGSTNRPVPSASAEYKSGVLVLTFPGLTYDGVYKALDNFKLTTSITTKTSRSGNESKYEFHGTSSQFRLSGQTSPNQVVFEIKL